MAALSRVWAIFGRAFERSDSKRRLKRSSICVGLFCSFMAGVGLFYRFEYRSWANACNPERGGMGASPQWQPIPLRSIGCHCGEPLLRAETFTDKLLHYPMQPGMLASSPKEKPSKNPEKALEFFPLFWSTTLILPETHRMNHLSLTS